MRSSRRSPWSSTAEVLRFVWSQATPFVMRRFIIVLALVLVAAALAPFGPVALKMIVDAFTVKGASAAAIAGFAALYVLSQWLSRSLFEVRALVYARAERRMFTSISDRLFDHIMRLPLRYHATRATGALNQTRENGLQGYQMIVHHLIFTALPVGGQLVVTVWILARIDQPFFLTTFVAAVVCCAAAFSVFVMRALKSAQEASSASIDASALIADNIMAYETVKFFTAESAVRRHVHEALSATEGGWVKFYRNYAINGLIVAAVFAIFLGISVGFAIRQVMAGHMSVGEFVLINTYMLQMMQPVEMLGYAVQGFSQGAAMLSKLLELLREEQEQSEPASSHSGASAYKPPMTDEAAVRLLANSKATNPAALEFRNVTLSYAAGRVVLTDVSFVLRPGETLGIVGTSGAGKSTIVRLLVRMLESDAGVILLDGVPLTGYELSDLRQAVAVVPQDTVLFNQSLRYNIGFGKFGATQEEIEDAARLAHLHDFIMNLPEKYDTKVGERGVKLSGGEKQRVSIARAALKAPRLYVFDEATSSLDSATEREIITNLRQLSQACTTVIIAHRLSTVVHADQIIVLEMGQLVERGTHHELIARAGKYAALWSAQQGGSSNTTVAAMG
jgi:ABC-type multidrug transport system fused ATPase/permease subunit